MEINGEQKLVIIIFLTALMLVGVFYLVRQRIEKPATLELKTNSQDSNYVIAEVSGAVNSPGVYRVTAGARYLDLISIAGGSSINANLASLNLAQTVKDGEKIYVPQFSPINDAAAGKEGDKVNINLADKSALKEIPGIGDKMAERIIACRDQNGRFSAIDDLRKVKGLGKAKLNKIKEFICLD